MMKMNITSVKVMTAVIVPTPYPNQSLRNALFDTTVNLNGFSPYISERGGIENNSLYPNCSDLPDEYTTLSDRSRNFVVAYTLIFFIAIGGNLTVFLSVCHQLDKLKWRITILILHLAIADLIVTFCVIPMEIFWRLTIGWVGGNALCKICQFCRAFGLYLSSNILICISLDRFFAIIFPLRMAGAAKRVKTMIIVAWIMAALFSLPQIFVFQVMSHPDYPSFHQCVAMGFFKTDLQEIIYNVFSVMAMFFLPLIFVISTYAMILWKITTKSHEHLQTKNQNLHGGTGTNCHLGSSDAAALLVRAKKRTLRLTLIIVIAYIILGSPYAIITLWYMFDKDSAAKVNPALQDALFMMVVANSCVNPIIYGRYTKKTLGKLVCPCSLKILRGRATPALVSQQDDGLMDNKRTSDLIAVTSVI